MSSLLHYFQRLSIVHARMVSSSSNLSGSTIAVIAIGTVLAVGVVCLLLFYPQFLFAWLMKSRSRHRPSETQNVPLKEPPLQRPGRASGNNVSSNGTGDRGRRRRDPAVVHDRITQPQGNQIVVSRPSGSHVIVNNNIHIDSNDYLQPLPALNSQRNRDPAPPVVGIPPNTQHVSGIRNYQFSSPPNGGVPPQRRRRSEPPVPPPREPAAGQPNASSFWNVGDWARGVTSEQAPQSPARGRTDSLFGRREQPPLRHAEGYPMRGRALHVPGTFPEGDEVEEIFQLVTAPARVQVLPPMGTMGFGYEERGKTDGEGRKRKIDVSAHFPSNYNRTL